MIASERGIHVLIALKPAGFRKGVNGLAAQMQETIKADPFSGVVFVFRAKHADRLKLVCWDGTGLFLLAKTQEIRRFPRPKIEESAMLLSHPYSLSR